MSNTSTNGDEPVKQTPRRLSVNQEAQILTTTEGRMGYVNEEHECFKDDIIKQLESEIEKLKAQVKTLEDRIKKK